MDGMDVLMNNAGISGPIVPIEELHPEDWAKVMQVDLKETFNVARMAVPYLKK